MSDFNDGGPAFPTENARQIGPASWHHEGMTLRDYFAGQALAGITATEQSQSYGKVDGYHFDAAQRAYAYADAMIEARKEKEESE